jgi:hypothetical protein
MDQYDIDQLTSPAARNFHGYDGDRPIHVAILGDRVLHVDRFRGDGNDRHFIAIGDGTATQRAYMSRAELLAMARDIIRELEG